MYITLEQCSSTARPQAGAGPQYSCCKATVTAVAVKLELSEGKQSVAA